MSLLSDLEALRAGSGLGERSDVSSQRSEISNQQSAISNPQSSVESRISSPGSPDSSDVIRSPRGEALRGPSSFVIPGRYLMATLAWLLLIEAGVELWYRA